MRVLHLDHAAVGQQSEASLRAVADHARLEAEIGGYVAEVEVAPRLARLRSDLAGLVGMEGEGVALLGGATPALEALLRAWALPDGSTVGVLPSEWGPNLETFVDAGLVPVQLPVDETGLLDLEAFGRLLRTAPPGVVHLVHVAAHRGLRQPVAEAASACREAGVALWVDAAQAVGQTVAWSGADVVYGTSRKWLRGPRGVGFLAVDRRHWGRLRVLRRAKWPEEPPLVHMLEPGETHVAGRVGLASAVTGFLASGPEQVAAELEAAGRRTREALADVRGWEVVPAQSGPITAVRPRAGQDVGAIRTRLLERHGILTTAILPWRAPLEPALGWLRLSPYADVVDADLERVAGALADQA